MWSLTISHFLISWNSMILRSLRLRDFRNFEERVFHFESGKNLIIWNNWVWKTNVLEALALPQSYLVEGNPLYHLSRWKNISSIQYDFDREHLLYTYTKSENKKRYFSEKKIISKKKFQTHYPHIISFYPQMMDLLYGSPSERRNFLDTLLCQSFPEYAHLLQHYKKVLTSRNKILARIYEWKSQASELQFWDTQYLELSISIYTYRDKIVSYIKNHITELIIYFFGKVEYIDFQYISKTPETQRWDYLTSYIKEHHEKEVYQRKTLRGPHLDDFMIVVDDIPIEHFASRWEIKSILLWFTFLWGNFIQDCSVKKDILFLIDDIFSELDTLHLDMIYSYIWTRQCIISSIRDISDEEVNKIYL